VLIAPFARRPKGTTDLRVLPLARALAGAGHEVTVLIPPYDHPIEGGRTYTVGEARVEALPVNGTVREDSLRQAVEQPRLAAAVARRALALRPEVVHVFKPKAVTGLTQMLLWSAARASGRPALVLDTDDWEGHGGWNEREAYPWWQKELCDWQERWGLRHADALTVASRTLEVQAWGRGVPPSAVFYLPNGLDAAEALGRGLGGEAQTSLVSTGSSRAVSPPMLLLYTRFFEFEPERVAQVLGYVREEVPAARLLVVGAGKYGQERRLLALARAQGMGESIVHAGWQAPETLPGLLAAGDVALVPADDNLANRAKCSAKLLQLLQIGIPVVADDVGQAAEYVEHGTHGLLSDPDDPRSMARAAVRLLHAPELARRLAESGRRRVEADFNWPRLARQAERAYEAALTGPTRVEPVEPGTRTGTWWLRGGGRPG
jgi:glycosyltransferase involved in cell wall biosynthesis